MNVNGIMDKELLPLIRDYLECSNKYCSMLMSTYKESVSLQRAKILKILPKTGTIGNVSYNFRGRGCYFRDAGTEIDIDFGPGGRNDGFDNYRLKKYLTSKGISTGEFDKQFDELISNGSIRKHPDYPDDHLFYLTNRFGNVSE